MYKRQHLRIRIDFHAAHHVVSGGPDLHRHLGDVDIAQLLELVVHAGQLALDMFGRVGQAFVDPGDVEKNTAMGTAAAFADLALDAAGDVVAGEQFGRAPRILVALGVAPAFLFVIGRRALVERRDVAEHEALSFAYTLRNNRFIMTNAVELKASSIGDISEILARVAGEYSTNFIAQDLVSNSSPTANFTGIPLARRVAYWNEKITQYFESDQALSFADRNTIMRVRTTLANYPNLKEIVFLDPGPAILE